MLVRILGGFTLDRVQQPLDVDRGTLLHSIGNGENITTSIAIEKNEYKPASSLSMMILYWRQHNNIQ